MIADATRTATISIDPNCRPNLVKDRDAYRTRMDSFAASADMIKMSDVDFDYLHGHDRYAERAETLLAAGRDLFVVTRGTSDTLAWHRSAGAVVVAAPSVIVVDTIGAGESFQATQQNTQHRQNRLAMA